MTKVPKRIELRPLTTEERKELEKLSRSQSGEHRLVERARIILSADNGEKAPAIASRIGVTPPTVYSRLKRFQTEGLAALHDMERLGRQPTYSEAERGIMIATARTHPDALDLPFGYWSLDRLVEYLSSTHNIGVSRVQLSRILKAEGLRWYQEKVYFSERPDPQFAEKRGL